MLYIHLCYFILLPANYSILFTFEKRPHYEVETILIFRLHLQESLACATVSPEMLWKPSSLFYILIFSSSRNFIFAAILTQGLMPLMLALNSVCSQDWL